jgi:23S rRNA A2030 N6-methylase RlmJ
VWCAAVTLSSGKRKYLYGHTRDAVANKLTVAQSEMRNGVVPPNRRETVRSWLNQYVDALEARNAAHATIVRYRGILKNYLVPQLGRRRLAELQPQDIQTYQTALLKSGFRRPV